MKLKKFEFRVARPLAALNRINSIFFNIKTLGICLFMFPVLWGCAGTEYTSRIRNEPFNIENVFRQAPSRQIKAENKSGTIWPGERSVNAFFSDERARMVGDIVTVSVVEVTTSKEQATTDLKRTGADVGLGIPNFLGLETNNFPSSINPASMVKATVKNDFKGDGATTRDGSIVATISAKVVEVMPNGNLAIEGKREITLNNERKEILFQGIVRPKDISAKNSVLSTQVADAKVILTGVGVIGEKQSPGWLARIFDVVWPF
jgi:flagellar L-ring protein precursor FlgH